MTKLTLKNFRTFSDNPHVLKLIEKVLKEGATLFAMESHELLGNQQYCCSLGRGFTAIKTNPLQFN